LPASRGTINRFGAPEESRPWPVLIVLGTSTSESALPRLMVKLEELGCSKSVVGLVVPTGYSFNLDGTSIYLSMAALFIAQAAHVTLSWGQQLEILGLLLLTSKGAAAVTGGGFVALAATLSTMHTLPVAGLALVFGVDRFMSEARALTNLIGNGVASRNGSERSMSVACTQFWTRPYDTESHDGF
jgi:aerobic C4-dicarboxylate transport protein